MYDAVRKQSDMRHYSPYHSTRNSLDYPAVLNNKGKAGASRGGEIKLPLQAYIAAAPSSLSNITILIDPENLSRGKSLPRLSLQV